MWRGETCNMHDSFMVTHLVSPSLSGQSPDDMVSQAEPGNQS